MIKIPIEPERGCGYRTVGKIYIVGSGFPVVCDNLPYLIEPCDCCGYEPQFMRGFSWLKKAYIKEHHRFVIVGEQGNLVEMQECNCLAEYCPICHPNTNDLEQYGFMWVGEKYYTPDEFIREAGIMGVSKAINKIPKDLILGRTWVVLAHPKVPVVSEGFMTGESDYKPAIFYAFIPKAFEMLVWESDATPERLAELREQGITPIVVPDGDEAHAWN